MALFNRNYREKWHYSTGTIGGTPLYAHPCLIRVRSKTAAANKEYNHAARLSYIAFFCCCTPDTSPTGSSHQVQRAGAILQQGIPSMWQSSVTATTEHAAATAAMEPLPQRLQHRCHRDPSPAQSLPLQRPAGRAASCVRSML